MFGFYHTCVHNTMHPCPKWNKEVPWVFPWIPGNFHTPMSVSFVLPPGIFRCPLEISIPPGNNHDTMVSVTPWKFPCFPGNFHLKPKKWLNILTYFPVCGFYHLVLPHVKIKRKLKECHGSHEIPRKFQEVSKKIWKTLKKIWRQIKENSKKNPRNFQENSKKIPRNSC